MAGRKKAAREMHGENIVEVLIRHRQEQAVAREARGVDENVDGAGTIDQRGDFARRCRVGPNEGDRQAIVPGLASGRGRDVVPMGVRGHDVVPVTRQGTRDRESKAAASSRDESASR